MILKQVGANKQQELLSCSGSVHFFMQILEIITTLGKTQLNEMAGRQTDLSFKNMILKYK